ncbi:MAG: hypothetical protein DME97_16090 [Verrucomicrobia bacterium]|nr:MAG: hypothetical protein DME97_16090 [Verrucomicrobiota bacterium]
MKIAGWFLLLLPCALLAQSREDPQLAAKAEALPPQIETVASGGYWTRDKQEGSFRLVIQLVGWEELSSRAFLQWIRMDHDRQESIIERTVPIKEIDGRWRVVSQKFVLRGKRWDIVIAAERRVPEAKATFTITPAADFSYTITTSEK